MAANPFRTNLIAPCGMDCAICMAFLREKNRCTGCWSPDRKCKKNCIIFSCDQIRDRYCHTCAGFPCKKLRQLDDRYRNKYGMSMIENLESIRAVGIREFAKMERGRWTCTTCGGTIDVHHHRCSSCGKDRG